MQRLILLGVNYTFGPLFSHKQHEDARKRKKPKKPKSQMPPPKEEIAAEPQFEDPISAADPHNPFTGAPVSGEETFVISNVMFVFDEDKIVLTGTKEILKNLRKYLYKEPVFKSLVIEGHTDYIGSNAYNQDLSEKRAASIKRYLIDNLQVDGSKMMSIGYGETRPVADNGNFQGRQLNRRVEFKITR
jgi:outer membrane protein OmpA-like peptidoglycan-associated protein